MDLYLDNCYINVKEAYWAALNYRPEKKITVTGRLWWKKVKEEEISKWQIEFDYLSASGANMKYTKGPGDDHAEMLNSFKSLMEQLKAYNTQWADRALEQAILNNGRS